MTGRPSDEIAGDSRRRRLFHREATASDALDRMRTFTRRALLLSLGFALLLAFTSTRAGAASSATSAGKFSASLTFNSFVASQSRAVKLINKFPAPSKSYSYKLSYKRGSAWLLVKSARKKGNFKSQAKISVSKLFAGRKIKVGFYRLQVSSAGAYKLLKFQIVPFSGNLTKKSFTIAEAKSIKLTYGFSKPSKSFAYRLLLKRGSKWQQLNRAKTTIKAKRRYLTGVKTASLKKLFGRHAFALGTYRLKISSSYSTRQLNFKIVQSADPATSTGGSGGGSGSGSTGGANFTISGDVSGLEPGLSLPIRLTLTNPNSTRIYVTRLTVSMSAESTPSGCSRDENFKVIQSDATSASPIAVPAKGKVTLTSAPRAPQISFLNLPTSQDVCKGKSFALTFTGSARS